MGHFFLGRIKSQLNIKDTPQIMKVPYWVDAILQSKATLSE